MKRLLLIARSDAWHGGVVAFVRAISAGAEGVTTERILIGREPTDGPLRSVTRSIGRILSAARRIARCSEGEQALLNTSLLPRALLRDGLIALLAGARSFHPCTSWLIHGWDEGMASRIDGSATIRWLIRRLDRSSHRFIVLSQSFKERMIAWGVAPGKILVIGSPFRPDESPEPVPGHRRVAPRLCFMARLVPGKGAATAVRIFGAVAGSEPELELDVVGDGPELAEIEATVSELGLDHRVTVHGRLNGEDKWGVLDRAVIFLYPTTYGEGCPIVVVEAMSRGLAIATTGSGGLSDLWEAGMKGAQIDASDVEGAAAACLRLLRRPDLMEIGGSNRRLANSSYSAGAIATRIIEHLFAPAALDGAEETAR